MTAAGEIDQPTVVVPGGAPEAEHVARRHPALAARVVASWSAHEDLGLFVSLGLQRSGTYVVQGGLIAYARHATVPLGSFDANEARLALQTARSRKDPTAEPA